MNDKSNLVVRLAYALCLTLLIHGCREDLGCPPGTVLVSDVCEAAPDQGPPPRDAALACDETCVACDGREETCDGEDNDCDGQTDEESDAACGTDEGTCSAGTQRCSDGVLGECEGAVGPALFEVCEGSADENCDGEVDEDCECAPGDTRSCGVDTGECTIGVQACTAEGVYGDCDGVGPAPESCNGLDDDCDGTPDEGNPGGGAACGSDEGRCTSGSEACVDGEIVCQGGVGPTDETCNGLDDDCSGATDEGVTTTYYLDDDGDGRGDPTVTTAGCSTPARYVTNASDCDDACPFCWTSAPELCDGLDNDCSGAVDEGATTRFYQDDDGDGRGTPTLWMDACAAPNGYVADVTDCDDTCDVCWTGSPDSCDGMDNDCSGAADEAFSCVQSSSVPCTTTCGTTGMGACTAACGVPVGETCLPPSEACNAGDDDCDGLVDEGLLGFTSNRGTLTASAAKVVAGASGFVGISRYNGVSRLYDTYADGMLFHDTLVLESENVVDVDIARISDSAWVTASSFSGGSVDVQLIGLVGGVPTPSYVERAYHAGDGGVARVAANSTTDAMVAFQAGTSARVAHIDFSGALASTVALPGSTPRPELGLDIAARGVGAGYVVAWVTGSTPSVSVAFVSAPSMSVTSSVVVGAGTNPALAVNGDGQVAVVYVGPDNRIRYHALHASLSCIAGGAAASCALSASEHLVATPVSTSAFLRTLDIEADGSRFWVAARTSEGELLLRLDQAVRDEIFRTDAVSSWVSVAAQPGAPLMARGGGTGVSHRSLGCP